MNNMFLKKDYELPKGDSKYMKFEQGANKFRVISSAITGYEYWTTDNKPVRLKEMPDEVPQDIRIENGMPQELKHFWAFAVITDGKVKILQITQKGIQREILDLVANKDWGDPKDYNITINRTGESLQTEYTVQPSPPTPLTADERKLADTKVNLEALWTGGDPFADEIPVIKAPENIADEMLAKGNFSSVNF